MTTLACTILMKSRKTTHYSMYGKEENRTNTRKNKEETFGPQSDNALHHHLPAYQI